MAIFSKWFRSVPASEKQLLHRCRGDREQLERLIQHEMTRLPGLSRASASQVALERWARDR